MQLFENTATIFQMLWDIALAYFVLRLGTIYAVLAFASTVAIGFMSTWATQRHKALETQALVPATNLALVVACALFVNKHYGIPRDWRLRAGVGGVGALLVTCATTVLRRAVADMELAMGGRAYMACVAAMPLLLTALERKPRKAERDSTGLLHGEEKTAF